MNKNSETVFGAFAVYSGVVLVAGVSLNGLVCATFAKYPSLLKSPNIFVFSMAISDLISSAIAAPMVLKANIDEKWPYGDMGCKGYAFVTTLCALASITLLAGAAFERYNAIKNAAKVTRTRSKKRVVCVAVCLWAYSLVFSVAPLLNWSSYTFEGIGTSCSVDWQSSSANSVSYTVSIFVCCFGVPLAVICVCYYQMYGIVRSLRVKASRTWGTRSWITLKSIKTENKMAFLLLIMIIVFLVAWTPYAVVSLISACRRSHWITPIGASIPAYIAKSSTIYNPIIYGIVYKRFREKAKYLLCSYTCICEFKSFSIKQNHSATHCHGSKEMQATSLWYRKRADNVLVVRN